MKYNLAIVGTDAFLYAAQDFSEDYYNLNYLINGEYAIVDFANENDAYIFQKILSDYILRVSVAKETKAVKEMIMQRALFDIV